MKEHSLEEQICLSKEGKAFKTKLSWVQHESAAWTETASLHGWVDHGSPFAHYSFKCTITHGPGLLWIWKVTVECGFTRYQARGYLEHERVPFYGMLGGSIEETLKNECFVAFQRLVGLHAVPP
jgi:hypothetical protein